MCLKIDSVAYVLFGTQGKHLDVGIKKDKSLPGQHRAPGENKL